MFGLRRFDSLLANSGMHLEIFFFEKISYLAYLVCSGRVFGTAQDYCLPFSFAYSAHFFLSSIFH